MNLKIISEQLKQEFSSIISTLPLNEIPEDMLASFLLFFKKTFFNLYKQFGINYASTLAREIGVLLIPFIKSCSKEDDYQRCLKRSTRTILKSLETTGSIDYSKYKDGMSGAFYESLTLLEKDVYKSYFIENIIGSDEYTIIEISRFCTINNLEFDDYFTILSRIGRKFMEWRKGFAKELNGYEIKF